ncbi:MAG: TonB-dependent siderophore receptor [Vicinamibacteria bacterium]|nr:TonB-dependent siderophore receptor [Vicinamibacteria bacterium]MBP9945595.1 TonB-dependent siderophore receptor [Vicinamibacteria bacterium]
MKHRHRHATNRRSTITKSSPQARWLTVGTLVAYAAFGSRTAARAEGKAGDSSPNSRAESQSQPVHRFDIPAGPLDVILAAFEQVSGLRVTMSEPSLRTLRSPGLTGSFTSDQALSLLLSGTRVTHRFTRPDEVTLEVRVHERVEVAARSLTPTSPRYTQPWRDIPQTITVIPKALMAEQSATTLRDVLRNVPGITMQAGEGGVPAGDNLSIRGFSARTDMFIDGVRDFGGYSRDAFNLEQVEVTKGPASAVAGRGSTGGAINLVTKTPATESSRGADFSGGNAEHKRVAVDINQPLSSGGGAAFRLNALFQDADAPGRDAVENNRWGVAPSISVGLRSRTQATLSYFRLDQDSIPDYGIPWVPATNVPLAAYANQAPPVDFDNFYGLSARDYEKTATDIATLTLRHQASPAVGVRNLTRYGRTRRDSVITAPRFAATTGTALNRQLQSRDQTDSIAANQTDLTARLDHLGLQHAMVAGVEVAREASENFLRTGPSAPLADLYSPDSSAPYSGPIVRSGAVNKGVADSFAAYLADTVKVGPRVELTGGLRFDRFAVDYDAKSVTGAVTSFTRTDDMLSFRAGVVYKPRPTGSVYAGLGTSINPSAEGLSLSAATVDLEPEKTRSYEIGTKWDLVTRRLALNAAIFRTEKTNARTPGINPGDPATVLQGEQRVNGFEVGFTGSLAPFWQAFMAFSFMDSDIRQSNTAAELDNELSLIPRTSFNLWTTVRLPRRIEVGGGAQFMDNVFRNALNTTAAPGYWLFSVTGSHVVNDRLTLRLNVNNLTDRDYIDRVGGGHFIPGAGRSAVVTASVNF